MIEESVKHRYRLLPESSECTDTVIKTDFRIQSLDLLDLVSRELI